MKIRILFLVTDLALGGTPRALESLVLGLDKKLFDVEVITMMGPSPITENLNRNGIPCHAWNLRSKADLPRLLSLAAHIVRARADILHCWLFHANILGRLVGWMTGSIVLSSERGVEKDKTVARVLVDRLTGLLTRRILVNAQAISDTLRAREGFPREKILVIENGVDVRGFRQVDRSGVGKRLVCVARLDPVKDHLGLVQMVKILRKKHPDVQLALVGEGSMRAAIEDAVRSLELGPHIQLLGARQDIPAVLESARVFVLGSRSEGLPGSILEAMASGLPVVATRVGGVPELVVHGETGYLVDAANPEQLAESVGEVLRDPIHAARMGDTGRRRVLDRFSREAFIRRHAEYYQELVRPGR